MFLEEVEDLRDRYHDRMQLVHVLSREPQEVELFSGRLDEDRLTRMLDTIIPPDTVDEWFLCGPFPMVQALRKVLVHAGVPKRSVHAEVFHVDSAPVRRTTAPTGAGTGARGDHHPRRPAVDVPARRRRPRRARRSRDRSRRRAVRLQGRRVRHLPGEGGRGRRGDGHELRLEPDEVEAGYVLTCQSHPTTDRLVLDYDA